MVLWLSGLALLGCSPAATAGPPPGNAEIIQAFGKQGIRINAAEAQGIRDNVLLALDEARAHGIGNSKVDFAAVEIANELGLDTSAGSTTVRNVVGALKYLLEHTQAAAPPKVTPRETPQPNEDWERYFDQTVSLWNEPGFLGLVHQKGFSPVKISWEDIGRDEGSVWGDRISDVGIWVRKRESDPQSARLALSVRRDNNFRDKVLLVPAAQIKIHQRIGDKTVEKTLPARLAELGLGSPKRDKNVIVSNQFAIVPVPARDMHGAWPRQVPPRAAFTFSIFPYGSTNFVITDVIEGSHEAIVGPGQHQLLFSRVEGERAPFTASRAEDRPDLLKLERELKAQGMDVDVQRYYLIQIPLRRDRSGIQLSNMGTPPFERGGTVYDLATPDLDAAKVTKGAAPPYATPMPPLMAPPPMPAGPQPTPPATQAPAAKVAGEANKDATAGLARVAIGHGVPEGPYFTGAGYNGARADEPVRVTVVYFVTPVGKVSRKDMETFAAAFAQWDSQAIWGGSFVTKESF
jgi:hypothetical protein